MGLDMYAYTTDEPITEAVDFSEPQKAEELHYWRKHPNLHGWMERLYHDKGGANSDFNMSPVKLDLADLDQLEGSIRKRNLPGTEGCFFGQSDGSEIEDDLDFVKKARGAIEQGRSVYYFAWW